MHFQKGDFVWKIPSRETCQHENNDPREVSDSESDSDEDMSPMEREILVEVEALLAEQINKINEKMFNQFYSMQVKHSKMFAEIKKKLKDEWTKFVEEINSVEETPEASEYSGSLSDLLNWPAESEQFYLLDDDDNDEKPE